MTVSELIKLLADWSPDTPVRTIHPEITLSKAELDGVMYDDTDGHLYILQKGE